MGRTQVGPVTIRVRYELETHRGGGIMVNAERALFELRQGRPVFLTRAGSRDRGVVMAPVEALRDETLNALRAFSPKPLTLVVTHHRARVLGVGAGTSANGNGNGNGVRSDGAALPGLTLTLDARHDPRRILLLASASAPSTLGGEAFRAARREEQAGLTLARLGRLLPALVAVEVEAGTGTPLRRRLAEGDLLGIPVEEVEALAGAPQLEVTHVSDAPVPLAVSERTRFILFRETHGFFQHVAILIGDRNEWPDPVPVRLHSACLTGDLFRSLRCDCGEQLQMSLELMTEQGGGVLLYLEQEGRGIGLGNKLRAYSLQEEGLDTVDADGALGFGADERRYDSAVEILRRLEVGRIRLLTNNPAKVAAVREGGIDVVDRQPLHGTLNRHNLPYVRAKVRRAGHWLEDMLAEALPPE
jgi:GTP cyclohydrolase II